MFTIRDEAAYAVLVAIDNGSAVKVAPACFVDGAEDEFHIDFYQLRGMVVRCEHNRRNTETRLDEVTGADLDLFKTIYNLH
jgi:hypothetical protein